MQLKLAVNAVIIPQFRLPLADGLAQFVLPGGIAGRHPLPFILQQVFQKRMTGLGKAVLALHNG